MYQKRLEMSQNVVQSGSKVEGVSDYIRLLSNGDIMCTNFRRIADLSKRLFEPCKRM